MPTPTKYRDWMPSLLVDLGKKGKTVTQCAAAFSEKLREEDPKLVGIARETLHQWSHDSSKPDWVESWPIYKTYLEDWWIDFGMKGILSGKAFQPAVYIYMMKCLFRDNWLADQKQTHEVRGDNVTTMSDDELTSHIINKLNSKLEDKNSKIKVVVNNG